MAWENSLAYSMRPEEFKLIAFAVNTFFPGVPLTQNQESNF